MGIYGNYRMAMDMITVLDDPHPMVRKAFLVPSANVTSPGPLEEVPHMSSWLAILQLLGIMINLQGVYWFLIILIRKGDYNSKRTQSDNIEKNHKIA